MRLIGVVWVAVLLAGLPACSFSLKKAGIEETSGTEGATPASSGGGVDYATVRKQLIEPKCLSCHTTRSPVLLTYDQVKANLGAIQATVITEETMPPSKPVSDSVQSMLASWIAAGAPEVVKNSDSSSTVSEPAPAPSPPPSQIAEIERPVRFSTLYPEIIEPRCGDCHFPGATNEEGDPIGAYDTYEDVKSNQGTIYHKIFSDKTEPMPPREATQLTETQREMLILWWVDGMLE